MKLSFNEEKKLDKFEVDYWVKFFSKNLKVGVEIECDGAGRAMSKYRTALKPTDNINKFGDYGVYKVTSDGSLNNGVEICTVGRRVDFRDMICQYKYITDLLENGNINSRCGLHNHILIAYGSNHTELEKDVPSVILRNFLQLIKLYYSGMVFITSTVYQPEHDTESFTRGHRFCEHDTLYSTNIITNDIRTLVSRISGSSRYKVANINFMKENGDNLKQFHLELRFPDGSIFPTQIASQNVMYQALLIKAIKLSRFGIVTTQESLEEAKELTNAIRNNYTWDGDNRLSKIPEPEQLVRIKGNGKELLNLIKEEVNEISKDAYDVLVSLSDKPVSYLRKEFEDDLEKVNDYLFNIVKKNYAEETENENLLRAIACTEITGMKNEDEWLKTYSVLNGLGELDVALAYAKLKKNYNFKFDEILGGIK